MEYTSIDKLNELLKGEEIATQAYENLIGSVKDDRIRNELQRIQSNHKGHTAKLIEEIQNLGGEPKYGTGIAGVMANMKMNLENLNKKDDIDILKKAYDGEDQGIAKVESMNMSDVGKESIKVIDRILSDDHDHLRMMAKMIGEYEQKR